MSIPKSTTEQQGIQKGQATGAIPEGERVTTRKSNDDLADLLSRVTADNLHPEQETGEPRGNEQW
jgi:antitoxin component of MazEF toxin-antitoxin module